MIDRRDTAQATTMRGRGDAARAGEPARDTEPSISSGPGLPEILRDRQSHVERVLRTGCERDQRAVAGVLDPVIDIRERGEIPAQNRRQRGLGSVLLGRGSLRVPDQVGEEKARDKRAARRMTLGFGHGDFTGGTLAPAISLRREIV